MQKNVPESAFPSSDTTTAANTRIILEIDIAILDIENTDKDIELVNDDMLKEPHIKNISNNAVPDIVESNTHPRTKKNK